MATRSNIGKINPDNTIEVIYCHWDGYLKGVGKTLLNHYKTTKKVNDLINLGSISSLQNQVSTKKPHSFTNPNKNTTVGYHRDRNETTQRNSKYTNLTDLRLNKRELEDFVYLYDISVKKWYLFNNDLIELTNELING